MLKHHFNIQLSFAGIALILCFLAVPAVSSAQEAPAPAEQTPVFSVKRSAGVDVLGDREICEGSETTLQVDGEYESYSWNTGSTERSITVKKAGIYEVTVKTKGGCTFTTGVNVRTKICT